MHSLCTSVQSRSPFPENHPELVMTSTFGPKALAGGVKQTSFFSLHLYLVGSQGCPAFGTHLSLRSPIS